ncbi:MAG TPA: cyanophycin synthetase, partial [Sphingobium sp.]|nr:cyanophycin synthetase [Sphingobium sp.]
FDKVKDAFVEFVENVPFYGAAMLCLDHPEVQAILPRVQDRRIVTYGFSAQADIRGENVQPIPGGNRFDVQIRERDGSTRRIEGIEMPMPGRHNVLNAMAAIGVALQMGINDTTIQTGFAKFGGVKRRFTKVGEIAVDGGIATVIDDYGHHPVEIKAVLAAAREGLSASGSGGRVIAVVQPHRFTRLRDLMDEFQQAFNDADIVYAAPVYPAGEQPIEGVDSAELVAGLKRRGHRHAATIEGADELARLVAADLQADDMIICLGAGDITKWAAGLAAAVTEKAKEAA